MEHPSLPLLPDSWTEYMCFKRDTSTIKGGLLKLVNKFSYLGNSVLSTENEINTRLAKARTAIDRLLVIWKSDLTDKIKQFFSKLFSILLYGCTTRTLTKRMEKRLDGNYTRMLPAVMNKSWKQHPIRQQLYGQLPPISKTIQVRRTRHTGHSWRCKDELISDVLLWTPSHRTKVGRPARTYIQQLCTDTRGSLEDFPGTMDDRDEWRKRVREICACSARWWWWWWWWMVTWSYNCFLMKIIISYLKPYNCEQTITMRVWWLKC